MKIIDITKDKEIVIHCKEEWMGKILMILFRELGLYWIDGDTYEPDNSYWYRYEDQTCYYPYAGEFGNLDVYCKKCDVDYKIVEFNEFIKRLPKEHKQLIVELM